MFSDLLARLIGTMAVARAHGATRNLLRIDDERLWDIGLRRCDIRDCLAARPDDAAEFLHVRQIRNVMATVSKLDSLGLWIGRAPGEALPAPANDEVAGFAPTARDDISSTGAAAI
jgi:uncharacterized protein YjiS (DUF1127 family)